MKDFFVAFFLIVLVTLAVPSVFSVSMNANIDAVRYFTPTAWLLISNRSGLQARDNSLVISGTDVTGISVTVANTGTSSYSFFLVIVYVYNTSGNLVAYGYDIFWSWSNPLDPGETYTTTITLNAPVPLNQTAYVVVQIR